MPEPKQTWAEAGQSIDDSSKDTGSTAATVAFRPASAPAAPDSATVGPEFKPEDHLKRIPGSPGGIRTSEISQDVKRQAYSPEGAAARAVLHSQLHRQFQDKIDTMGLGIEAKAKATDANRKFYEAATAREVEHTRKAAAAEALQRAKEEKSMADDEEGIRTYRRKPFTSVLQVILAGIGGAMSNYMAVKHRRPLEGGKFINDLIDRNLAMQDNMLDRARDALNFKGKQIERKRGDRERARLEALEALKKDMLTNGIKVPAETTEDRVEAATKYGRMRPEERQTEAERLQQESDRLNGFIQEQTGGDPDWSPDPDFLREKVKAESAAKAAAKPEVQPADAPALESHQTILTAPSPQFGWRQGQEQSSQSLQMQQIASPIPSTSEPEQFDPGTSLPERLALASEEVDRNNRELALLKLAGDPNTVTLRPMSEPNVAEILAMQEEAIKLTKEKIAALDAAEKTLGGEISTREVKKYVPGTPGRYEIKDLGALTKTFTPEQLKAKYETALQMKQLGVDPQKALLAALATRTTSQSALDPKEFVAIGVNSTDKGRVVAHVPKTLALHAAKELRGTSDLIAGLDRHIATIEKSTLAGRAGLDREALGKLTSQAGQLVMNWSKGVGAGAYDNGLRALGDEVFPKAVKTLSLTNAAQVIAVLKDIRAQAADRAASALNTYAGGGSVQFLGNDGLVIDLTNRTPDYTRVLFGELPQEKPTAVDDAAAAEKLENVGHDRLVSEATKESTWPAIKKLFKADDSYHKAK